MRTRPYGMMFRTLVFVVIAGATMLHGCVRVGETVFFEDAIAQTDDYLAAGAIVEASTSLDEAESVARSRSEWMRVLKRRLSIAFSGDDWDEFAASATSAFQTYPGKGDFAALRAYGAVRSGNQAKAESIDREYLDGRGWKALSDEIWLTGYVIRSETAESESVLPANYSADLDENDAAILLAAGERFDAASLFLDAALIFAGRGMYLRAFDAIGRYASSFPAITALIAYDGGDFERAFSAIEPLVAEPDSAAGLLTEDEVLTFADIAKAAERDEVSRLLYASLIAKRGEASWIPYANLARDLRIGRRHAEALRLLDLAGEYGHTNRALYVERILTAAESGNVSRAKEYIESFSYDFPRAYEIAVLRLIVDRSPVSSRRAVVAAKEAFYADPANGDAAFLTVKLLANAGDFRGIEIVLAEHLSHAPAVEWTDFFVGYAHVFYERFIKALTHFIAAAEGSKRWQNVYNLASVYAALSEYDAARAELRRAEAYTDDQKTRARIILEIAKLHALDGDIESAGREASYASELDSALTEAKLFLEELETRSP